MSAKCGTSSGLEQRVRSILINTKRSGSEIKGAKGLWIDRGYVLSSGLVGQSQSRIVEDIHIYQAFRITYYLSDFQDVR